MTEQLIPEKQQVICPHCLGIGCIPKNVAPFVGGLKTEVVTIYEKCLYCAGIGKKAAILGG